jgi:hypothetical protein
MNAMSATEDFHQQVVLYCIRKHILGAKIMNAIFAIKNLPFQALYRGTKELTHRTNNTNATFAQ